MSGYPTTRQFLWGALAIGWLLAGIAIVGHGWTVSGGWTAIGALGLGMIRLFHDPAPGTRPRRLLDTVESVALLSLTGMLGIVVSYLIAAHSTGYHDATLAKWDSVVGLDWKSWYQVMDRAPVLQFFSIAVYLGVFLFYPLIIIAILCFHDQQDRSLLFIAAYFTALAITLGIFYYIPAGSPMTHYLGTDHAGGYVPAAPFVHIDVIDGLRSGTLTHIDFQKLHGLIVFPSFHSVATLLFVWASWSIRWLRPTALGLNGAMLMTVPIEGTHYFVDVAGGLLVATAAILIVRRAGALAPLPAAGKAAPRWARAPAVSAAPSAPHP